MKASGAFLLPELCKGRNALRPATLMHVWRKESKILRPGVYSAELPRLLYRACL